MTAIQNNARFSFNNYLDATTRTTSGDLSGYPASNLIDPIRSKLWKASNLFEIHSGNNKIYIDAATYTFTTGLRTFAQIASQFNSLTGGTLIRGDGDRITMSFGSSKTFKFSNQTNAMWSVLGYLGTTDETGTAKIADETRYNTGAWIKVDLGLPQDVNFAALLAESGQVFGSNTAEIRLQGNNLDLWTETLPVDLPFEVSGEGAFIAPNPAQPCRFWRIFINDPKNDDITAAVAYLGSSVIPQNTNISTGFTRSREDLSVRMFSEGGSMYIDRRPKVLSLTSLGVQFLKDDELIEMEQLFYDLGVEKPFFLCIDPGKNVSTNLSQMTHYVSVTSPLQLQHVLRGYYNLSVELREVL